MQEIIIYEIPIYPKSESAFNKISEVKKTNLIQEAMIKGFSKEEAEQSISSLTYPKTIWKYNQIIGFVTISLTKQDIIFNIHCSLDKRYLIDSKTKHYMVDWNINGAHFNTTNSDNTIIKNKIKEYLKKVKTDHLQKYYLDCSVFDSTIDCLDIEMIINKL